MEGKVKSEDASEISLTAVVDSTSDVAHLNVVKKEISLSESISYGGLVLKHAVGSIYSGSNLKLKMEEVKPEVTSDDTLLSAIVDSTSDVASLYEFKQEFPLSVPHSCGDFVEHVVAKHKDTNSQSLNLHIKSEVPDLKCGLKSVNDDDIKVEHLVSEEVHIKDKIEEIFIDDPIVMSTQVQYFYCGLCTSKFEFKKNLQRHMKVHTGEKPFQCSICDYKCRDKSMLQHHIKTHTGEKPHQCNICDYKCIQKSALLIHMKTHTGEKPFQCNICGYKCIQNSTLQLHIKTHTGEKPFQCTICNYKCIRRNILQLHIKTHTREKPFRCYICGYKCIQKDALQQHMKTHTNIQSLNLQIKSKVPDLKCCLKSVNDDIIRLEHFVSEEVHLKDEIEESLVDQAIIMSTQVQYFYCGLCDSKFEFKKNLQRHMKAHTGEKPVQCKICDYKCRDKSMLQHHIKTHTGEKPHQCNICDYKCIQKSALLIHMKIHTGEKPFQCDICGYKCIQNSTLQLHIKTHTGEKPFQCNICDYKCIRKNILQLHIRTHTGEKPFTCNLCNYKCTRKDKLKQHIKTHTEEKSFQCNLCD